MNEHRLGFIEEFAPPFGPMYRQNMLFPTWASFGHV